ncbi:hypothetical protein PtA15_16A172 [Puccinia triticina]|uniref:Uncharacterized protein n=1 Tax=Puccinia triticina TaxID=208348 RepID=A0ABY7D4D2_9BASI|nr:uncharacterized protein PtA15_16A172 [Puccinia triticina]WAQ92266.1 hypothetical protein PtA15_16A172 [Puccinia triticina]
MHSKSLSISFLTLVSITNALSLPMDQEYQSGTPPTDLNPEILQTMDGPMKKSDYFPSGKFMSGKGPKSELVSEQLVAESGRSAIDKSSKDAGYSLPSDSYQSENFNQAPKIPSAPGQLNHPGNPYSPTFLPFPSYGQNGLPAGTNFEGNPPGGHPPMFHERPSASQPTATRPRKPHQNPPPGGLQIDENPAQDLPDREDNTGESKGINKLPKRRVSSNTLIGRETKQGVRAVLDLHTALERRQDDNELANGLNDSDDDPFSDFFFPTASDGEPGDVELANPDIPTGTGLKRRNSIENSSHGLRRRHNGEDHSMKGLKDMTKQAGGGSQGGHVKQTENIPSENAGDQAEKGPARKMESEDPTTTETSQQGIPTENPGMPSATNNLNTNLSNSQVEGLSIPDPMGKPQTHPSSFPPQSQTQRFSPEDQESGIRTSIGSPVIDLDAQTGQEGLQSQFMGGKSDSLSPKGSNGLNIGPTEGSPFDMGADSRNVDGESITAEMEDASGDGEGDDEEENPEEGQEGEADQSPGPLMASLGAKPAPSSENVGSPNTLSSDEVELALN